MRKLHPSAFQVELARLARGQNDVIVNGLHLNPPPAGPAAVIALSVGARRRVGSFGDAGLKLAEPAVIIAGGRKTALAQELVRGGDLLRGDGRARMDA